MRTRRLLPLAALLATAAALGVPAAVADNQAIKATPDDVYVPSTVAVKPGETVSFTNTGGEHNVVWNDRGVPPQPSDAVDPPEWPAAGVSRTFTRSGKFRFYCVSHGDPQINEGMFGYVYVNAAGQIPPILRAASATGANRHGVRLKFRSTSAGKAKATFFRKSGRRFVKSGASTFTVAKGLVSKRVSRALSKGGWRVEIVVTDANRLASDKTTRTFTVA